MILLLVRLKLALVGALRIFRGHRASEEVSRNPGVVGSLQLRPATSIHSRLLPNSVSEPTPEHNVK